MDWLENLTKRLNLTFDTLIKFLIEWASSNEMYRTRFENFARTKSPLSNLELKNDKVKAIYLFESTYDWYTKWAKEKDLSLTQAINLVLNSFATLSDDSQDCLYKFSFIPKALDKDRENPSKEVGNGFQT